jgi:hypothetical protein
MIEDMAYLTFENVGSFTKIKVCKILELLPELLQKIMAGC